MNYEAVNHRNQCFGLCLVHVIWTEGRMSKLMLNVKYLLLLFFLTAVEFYNLGHIQGITYKGTSHSAYAATETESNGAKIDGLLLSNFL